MPQPLAVTAFMASPGRFELPAPRLGGVCSIQLSYGDIFDFSWSRMERSASQDFDDLIIRRRSLYTAELRRHIIYIFIGTSEQAAYSLAPTLWWRRGELNPRPKTHPQKLLRAQTVIAGVFLPVPLPDGKPSRRPVR